MQSGRGMTRSRFTSAAAPAPALKDGKSDRVSTSAQVNATSALHAT
jgi:hypothetical protein